MDSFLVNESKNTSGLNSRHFKTNEFSNVQEITIYYKNKKEDLVRFNGGVEVNKFIQ